MAFTTKLFGSTQKGKPVTATNQLYLQRIRQVFHLMAVLILFASSPLCARAEQSASVPLPEITPAPFKLSLTNSVSVSVTFSQADGAQTFRLKKETLHLHENGLFGDGILFFMPLEEYVQRNDSIITIPLAPDFEYTVTADDVDTLRYNHMLFQQSENELIPLPEALLNPAELKSGLYLLQISFSVYRESDTYSGASFAWLTVE